MLEIEPLGSNETDQLREDSVALEWQWPFSYFVRKVSIDLLCIQIQIEFELI